MANWSRNYTVFIGPEATIDRIYDTIDRTTGVFNFNELYPVPEIYNYFDDCFPKITVPGAFSEHYGAPCPATIDEFIAFCKTHSPNTKLDYVPLPVFKQIQKQYIHPGKDDWCSAHWGTRKEGCNIIVHHASAHLLIVEYDTPWLPPDKLLDHLIGNDPRLCIINGAEVESFDDSLLEMTHGNENAFYTYFTLETKAVLCDLGPDEPPAIQYEKALHPNVDMINALADRNVLVLPMGDIVDKEQFLSTHN